MTCIGVFDSGVGGLSVLRSIRAALPSADLLYVADSAHAPYGERSDATILARSLRLTRHLADQGAQAIVVACNTATAVAVAELRRSFDPLPIIGVEPGIKPALLATRNGHIGVMATGATLRSAKFQSLLAAHSGRATVHLQACHGLAAAIERGDLGAPELIHLVERHCAPLRTAGVDTVVLGCTHYAFVRDLIQGTLGPAVQTIDTADAVARQTAQVCARFGAGVAAAPVDGRVRLQGTGNVDLLREFAARWLAFAFDVGPAPLQV